jgi:hypothetical protein
MILCGQTAPDIDDVKLVGSDARTQAKAQELVHKYEASDWEHVVSLNLNSLRKIPHIICTGNISRNPI